MKKKHISIAIVAILTMITFSCEPRIGFDDGQWGTHAELTSVTYFFVWQIDDVQLNEMTTGAKRNPITISSDVDEASLTNTVTVKAEYDLSKIASYIYHNGERIEPLNGAPTPGIIGDHSGKQFVYRIHSADGEYKDWTIKIVQ